MLMQMIFSCILLLSVVTFLVLVITSLYCTGKEIENPIGKLWETINYRNRLYKCDSSYCNRMFRYYQWNLYKARHNKSRCPHCESSYFMMIYSRSSEVEKQEGWMSVHQDCPKISLLETFNINRTMSKLSKVKEEEESIKRFEEYNRLKVDLKWIENLQKNK